MPRSLRMMAVYSGFWIEPPVVPAFQATALPQRRPWRAASVLRLGDGAGGGVDAGVGEGPEETGEEPLYPDPPQPATESAASPARASRRVDGKQGIITWRAPCAVGADGSQSLPAGTQGRSKSRSASSCRLARASIRWPARSGFRRSRRPSRTFRRL